MRSSSFALVMGLLASAGCSKTPQPQPTKAAPAAEAPAQNAKASEPVAAAEEETKPKPKPLSEEDKRLIAADPAELTPEMRRKRAYALRRKAMQNPDSPLARTLTDLQKAYENGQIDPNSDKAMPVFTVDGKPPTNGPKPMGPAGARPAEE